MLQKVTSLSKVKSVDPKYFSLPYIPHLSEKIQYYLKKYDIQISHKVSNTLKAILYTKIEDIDRLQTSGVY